MKLNRRIVAGCILAAIAAVPAFAAPHFPAPSADAKRVLGDLRDAAYVTLNEADHLSSISMLDASDWQAHGRALYLLSDSINAIGKKLVELQRVESAQSPEFQAGADRATVLTRELAADTTKAIQFVHNRQGWLWMPEYRTYARSIAQKAGELTRVLDHYDGWLQMKDRELRQLLSAE